MKDEGGARGSQNRCLRSNARKRHHEEPLFPLMYLSCPIFFPIDFPVCDCVQKLFENGNLMVIVMNVDLADQKSRSETVWEEVCLDAPVSSVSRGAMIWGKHDYFIFFPLSSAFCCTQGSRLLQQGGALPWLASLEGFLQATSRLFGCHWDCLKRICFCTILQGVPNQEKGEEKRKKKKTKQKKITLEHLTLLLCICQ